MADRFPLIIDNSAEKIKELVSGDNLDLTKSNLKNADHIQSAGVNVAGVATATSLIGDGSQLTNLPPSGGSLTATASGTLADGSKVIVNADGTVSVVAQTETTGPGVGSEEVFESTVWSTTYVSGAFDPTNNKVVVAWGSSNYGKAVVGTVSGTDITFGTAVTFHSARTEDISVVYDSSNNKVVIAYADGSNMSSYNGTAIVGTVSGTSISFGTPVVFESASYTQYTSTVYDSSNNRVVIAYRDHGNSYYGTAIVGTVSGTSISFGSPVVFESANVFHISAGYDSTNNKVVIAYDDSGNSNYGTAIVGTVSGTSISFGTPVVFESGSNAFLSAIYDSTSGKIFLAYKDDANDNSGTVTLGTVDPSTNAITFASPTVSVFNSGYTQYIAPIYDSSNDKVVIAYQDRGNSEIGTAVVYGTTSGFPLPSVGSPTVFETGTSQYIAATYDSSNQKVVIAYTDQTNSAYGTAIVGTVSGTSISFGTPVVFNSASSSRISSAYDSANQKVVISYRDEGNSSQGTAIVGTVSGTSISFGSSAVFESGNTGETFVTYDSTNGKVVVACRDQGNNDYGTAVVGTVSGTSISFGSPTVFESAETDWISAAYDSTNNKVVIAYRDRGDSDYGKAIVGTVSGTSISFGSPVTFNSGSSRYIASTFDSSNNKVVIAYQDYGNSFVGTAVVGTVSGTSISFGSEVVFDSSSALYISATYDSTNNKVVIAYRDGGNSDYGTAIVGTVSGTSISFGSEVVFESDVSQYISAAYDSTNQKVVIAYQDSANSYYGTSVVFSPVTIASNLTAENYIGISDGAYSNGQTATIQIMGAVDDAQSSLTPGQAYYVQDDGTLGESGSVFAGTAIAATKLIVRG